MSRAHDDMIVTMMSSRVRDDIIVMMMSSWTLPGSPACMPHLAIVGGLGLGGRGLGTVRPEHTSLHPPIPLKCSKCSGGH